MGRQDNTNHTLLVTVVWIGVVLFCMLGLHRCSQGVGSEYSEGERTGVVIRMSKRGIFWKSWEGMMHLGAGSSDGTANGLMVPVPWEFSSTDPSVVPVLQEAARTGKRVTLRYKQWFWKPWSVETAVDITEVEVTGTGSEKKP